jgi:hypothetical protein
MGLMTVWGSVKNTSMNRSAMIAAERIPSFRSWRTERDGTLKDKPGEDKVRLCTGEGSGPKTIRVEWPVTWSDKYIGIEHICVRVSLDLNGDGSLWLPMPAGETGAAIKDESKGEEGLECELHDWVEIREVLQMHSEKRTALGVAKRHAYNAKIEPLLKQAEEP